MLARARTHTHATHKAHKIQPTTLGVLLDPRTAAGTDVYCRMAPRAGPGAKRPVLLAGRIQTPGPVQTLRRGSVRASTVVRQRSTRPEPTHLGAYACALTRVPARSLAGGLSDLGNGETAAGSGLRTRIPPRTSSARWRAAHLAEREAAWSPDASTPFVCLFVCYGVRPRRTSALEDQLGLIPSMKSKIEDGSAMGTGWTLGAAVLDF
jgi:hypothetical protein